MRVFVSSTCYDLIDLRAELEAFFRQAGVEPVMSDSLISDFQVSPDQNSIETCLANIRTCEHFIIILSSRYGPTLDKAGYPEVSATHLEYLEAKKSEIPIHMYVRDRLEADFAIWKSNRDKPDLKLTWCRSTTDRRVFELLEEHRKLERTAGNNWLWVFRNSLELKERIRLDFRDALASAAVQALFSAGNLPLLEVQGVYRSYDGQSLQFTLLLRNVGKGAAVAPELEVLHANDRWQLKTLHPRDEFTINTQWAMRSGTRIDLETRLTYSTLQGYKFSDEAALSLWFNLGGNASSSGVSYTLKERRYLGASDAALLKMPRFS
jgi:hypothetical protein